MRTAGSRRGAKRAARDYGGGSTDFVLDFIGYSTTAWSAKSADQVAFERRADAAAGRLAAR